MSAANDFRSNHTSPTKEMLQGVEAELGFLPNIFLEVAESAPVLAGLIQLNNLFSRSSLSPVEQQVVQLAASVENHCSYCVAGHTMFMSASNDGCETAGAIRDQQALSDKKLDQLSLFTSLLVRQRGHVSDENLEHFFAAGYSYKSVLDVVLGISIKTITNLTNNISNVELDRPFEDHSWAPRSKKI
jgi:alkylhydroperoxidase family enzyme